MEKLENSKLEYIQFVSEKPNHWLDIYGTQKTISVKGEFCRDYKIRGPNQFLNNVEFLMINNNNNNNWETAESFKSRTVSMR